MATKKEEVSVKKVSIPAPNFPVVSLEIEGTAPYVQHKFSAKARQQIKDTQEAGQTAKSKTLREPKDFEAACEGAKHYSVEGWIGIPCPNFTHGMVSACRTVNYKMTHAKLAASVIADGFDADDGTPLVKITRGEPKQHIAPVRNDNGSIDLRARPMWAPGWRAVVRVRYDDKMFTKEDVINLVMRVGLQVGIGEGRPDSRNSAGLGWGLFKIVSVDGVEVE